MRLSCNGCRVLRKGCSEDCSIKPCLQWIKSPESQANATVFLAKFYGRAGLVNLINAGPDHLRPAIFRSLLYEACGRIVNPIYGSVGLLWSGNWQLCQNAVEAVLRGAPITQIAAEAAETNHGPPLKAYDIRHVSKNEKLDGSGNDLHRVRSRCRFKRSSGKPKTGKQVSVGPLVDDEENRSTSHDSSLSHQSETAAAAAETVRRTVEGDCRDSESSASEETAEAEILERLKDGSAVRNTTKTTDEQAELGEIELELTLGFQSSSTASASRKPKQTWRNDAGGVAVACRMEL